MLVTINTDASFYYNEKAGGFAFWISTDVGRYKVSGALFNVKNSHDAELKAIGNALAFLKKANLPDVHKIIVNTDCKFAINSIKSHGGNKVATSIHNFIKDIRRYYKKHHGKWDDFIDFRYVAAHTGENDKRSFVNEWCDKEAKEWARRVKNGLIKVNETRTKIHT